MNMVTFILTPEEAQFVINQVATLPYNQVSGLVEKLVTQGRVSQQPQPEPMEVQVGYAEAPGVSQAQEVNC